MARTLKSRPVEMTGTGGMCWGLPNPRFKALYPRSWVITEVPQG